MPKPDKDRKRTKDIGSLMEGQKKGELKAMTSRRHLKQKHEEDESDSDDEIKFSKKELLALLKTKNLRKLTKSSKLQFKKKRDKEEDSEESHEKSSEDEQEDDDDEQEEARVKENEEKKKEKTN